MNALYLPGKQLKRLIQAQQAVWDEDIMDQVKNQYAKLSSRKQFKARHRLIIKLQEYIEQFENTLKTLDNLGILS